MAAPALVREDWKSHLWRLNNLYFIVNKQGRRVQFNMNDEQAKFMHEMHGRDLILKARQRGFTTLCCLVGLDEALFNPNWAVAIIAHRLSDAQTIFATKVKYPYENLPGQLRARLSLIRDSADTLALSNGSTISVTTSARSGTIQRLHISEFGKICAQYPQKAKEIISGSIPAAENGAITIESTAEGQQGAFYSMCDRSRQRDPVSRLEWKFHFFPWWGGVEHVAPADSAIIGPDDALYFTKLEGEGITLTPEQQAWWVLTEQTQGGEMKREYPATADEAFEQALQGAYFEQQLAHAVKRGSIGRYPFDVGYPVNTFWDLGRSDYTTIWLHQRISGRDRFVGYYENNGEHITHFLRWLRGWGAEMDAEWGDHYWPHDGKHEDLFLEDGRLGVAKENNFFPKIVPRTPDKIQAIEAARQRFANCDFDEVSCKTGLHRLRHYRKEWDDQREVWRDRPRHDENSHGADGFMTFATGLRSEPVMVPGSNLHLARTVDPNARNPYIRRR